MKVIPILQIALIFQDVLCTAAAAIVVVLNIFLINQLKTLVNVILSLFLQLLFNVLIIFNYCQQHAISRFKYELSSSLFLKHNTNIKIGK